MSQINLQQKFNTIDTVIASVTNQSTLSPGQLQDKFLQFNQSGNLVAVDLDVSSIFPQLVVYSQNGTNLTISNYETEYSNPNFDTIKKFIDVCNFEIKFIDKENNKIYSIEELSKEMDF